MCLFIFSQCKPIKETQTKQITHVEKKDTVKTVAIVPKEKIKVEDTLVINIGFLMPFYFDENLKPQEDDTQPEEIYAPSLPSLEFYEGAKMAADSFSTDLLKINLKTYDIGDSLKCQKLINGTQIYSNDFIIASSPANLTDLILKAEKTNTHLIWNSSASNKSKQLMQCQPTNQTMINNMATYIAKNFAEAKIIVIYRDVKKEKELGDWFAAQIDTAFVNENGDTSKTTLINYSTAKTSGLISSLHKTKKNLLVVASSGEAFISSLVKILNDTTDVYSIQLCGLPTWENFESINLVELQQLQTLIFSTNYVDYTNEELNNFRKSFIIKYATDPLYQAYQGFFLMKGLIKIKNLNKVWGDSININSYFEKELFHFNWLTPFEGYENSKMSILKFDNYKLVKQ